MHASILKIIIEKKGFYIDHMSVRMVFIVCMITQTMAAEWLGPGDIHRNHDLIMQMEREKQYTTVYSMLKESCTKSDDLSVYACLNGVLYYCSTGNTEQCSFFSDQLDKKPDKIESINIIKTYSHEKTATMRSKSYTFYEKARVYAQKGQTLLALESLENAIQHGFNARKAIENNPDFSKIRIEPKYAEIISKLTDNVNTTDRLAVLGVLRNPLFGMFDLAYDFESYMKNPQKTHPLHQYFVSVDLLKNKKFDQSGQIMIEFLKYFHHYCEQKKKYNLFKFAYLYIWQDSHFLKLKQSVSFQTEMIKIGEQMGFSKQWLKQ